MYVIQKKEKCEECNGVGGLCVRDKTPRKNGEVYFKEVCNGYVYTEVDLIDVLEDLGLLSDGVTGNWEAWRSRLPDVR